VVVVSLYEERCEEQNKYHMKKAIHVIACAHLNFWKSVRTIDLIPSPREAGRGLGRGARNLLSPALSSTAWKRGRSLKKQKLSCALIACSLVLGLSPVFGQPQNSGLPPALERQKPSSAPAAVLSTFDLTFPGGSATDLVKAIEAARGFKPLNVIIGKEDDDIQLPPLKMTGVNVAQLFQALEPMSLKTVAVVTGTYSHGPGQPSSQYSLTTTKYGFKTAGEPTENSIWYFHVERPTYPPLVPTGKVCRFFSLAPYLDRGFTVDDITTAIQTGWKMAKESSPPELNYHKETKLLMAFGDPDELKTIDTVLETLPSSNATRTELDALRQSIKELQAKVNALAPPAH